MTIDADLVTRKMMLIARDLDALVSIRERGGSAPSRDCPSRGSSRN
jgi:hypothetical protein